MILFNLSLSPSQTALQVSFPPINFKTSTCDSSDHFNQSVLISKNDSKFPFHIFSLLLGSCSAKLRLEDRSSLKTVFIYQRSMVKLM